MVSFSPRVHFYEASISVVGHGESAHSPRITGNYQLRLRWKQLGEAKDCGSLGTGEPWVGCGLLAVGNEEFEPCQDD